jgi:head-tail adaptor
MGCKRINFNSSRVCASDLHHSIRIINRKIEPDNLGWKQDLTDGVSTRAGIKVRRDIMNFDGTNTETQITHEFFIRKGITVQKNYTIRFDNRYFAVIGVENIDEDNMFIRITASESGTVNNKANF